MGSSEEGIREDEKLLIKRFLIILFLTLLKIEILNFLRLFFKCEKLKIYHFDKGRNHKHLARPHILSKRQIIGMANSSLPVALIIGEKPSVAKSVSDALCRHSPVRTTKNFATPLHEFNGSFNGEPVVFCCTSVTGHVMNLDFKSQYNNWAEVDPKDLFSVFPAFSGFYNFLISPWFLSVLVVFPY